MKLNEVRSQIFYIIDGYKEFKKDMVVLTFSLAFFPPCQ